MSHIDGTVANFEQEVLQAKELVIVDFWAPWCGPCRMLAPTLDELGAMEQYQGKVKIVKINVDEEEELSMQYKISSIPAIKFFKDGKIIKEFVGVRDKKEFIIAIDESAGATPTMNIA